MSRPQAQNWMRAFARLALLAALSSAIGAQALPGSADPAGQQGVEEEDLGDLSLEELMDVEITSAAKKTQKLSDAVGAVYVITSEDIRRMGMTNIPDVLRSVPGVHVARINGSTYSVTARGFGGQFANKLLVMIDGRTVYSPVFSGVYWNAKDVELQDVQRIEVVRGPGGALWGVNAVNGVINIITRSAAETQGGVAYGGVGTEERVMAGGRFGFEVDARTHARIYAKYFLRDGLVDSTGRNVNDDWSAVRAGFRIDRQIDETTVGTLQGDVYSGSSRTVNRELLASAPFERLRMFDTDSEGGNLLGRWQRSRSDVETMVQVYYDYAENDSGVLRQSRHTLDLETQIRLPIAGGHEVMAGLGYRLLDYRLRGKGSVGFGDGKETDQLFNGFVRTEFALAGEALTLALGLKVGHNEYTGFEVQPDARLRWRSAEDHTFWVAASRAVRVPSLLELGATAVVSSQPGPGGLPAQGQLTGRGDPDSETVNVAEFGYRVQVTDSLSLDFASFYNDYDNIINLQAVGAPRVEPMVPRIVQDVQFGNDSHGESYGVEIAGQWRATDRLAFAASYAYMRVQIHAADQVLAAVAEQAEGDHPRHSGHLRLRWNPTADLELDSALYYVDRLSTYGIPSYLRWDLRLGWTPTPDTEASLVFQNLLDDGHAEFGTQFTEQPGESQRGVYLKFLTRF